MIILVAFVTGTQTIFGEVSATMCLRNNVVYCEFMCNPQYAHS